MSRRHLDKLPPERNRVSCGMRALAGFTHESPSVKSAIVGALRDAGVVGTWTGDWVYADPAFAEAWERTVTRFKTVPLRGARMRNAVARAASKMGAAS